MERNMAQVKPKRRYDATRRREHARSRREAILDAAERQFTAYGYASTTIAGIAAEADVSVETIYKTFGSKSKLVGAIYDRGVAGRGPVPAYQRSDEMRAQEQDPHNIMREWGLLTAEVASVVSPIRLLMRSAAVADPEIATLLEDNEGERLDRMRHHARFLSERGYLRAGITVAEATDVLWICSSVEFYELLVLRRGWSLQRFAEFVATFMMAALLPDI